MFSLMADLPILFLRMAPQGNSRTSVNLVDMANLVGIVTKATSLLNKKRSYKTVTPFFNMSPQVRRREQALGVFAALRA